MIRTFLRQLYYKIWPIRNRGKNNRISLPSKKCIIIINGDNNVINIAQNVILTNCTITINGDNNKINIDTNVKIYGPVSIQMFGNATLRIKENTRLRGVRFVIKNGDVEFGKDCMTSYGVLIRNTDMHKVIDIATNKITNIDKNIIIGNHVWICENVTILKGVTIGNNSIVAYGSVVTKNCKENSIIGGNPSKIIKQGISWEV